MPGDRLSVTRCRHLGADDAELLVLADAADVAIGSLGRTLRWRISSAGGPGRWLTQGAIASVADAATPPGSVLGSLDMLMTYRAEVVTARHGNVAVSR